MTEPIDRCTDPEHKGHSYHIGGGIMDGKASHHLYATPSDFPMHKSTALTRGGRSWYEIDYEMSDGTDVVYRFVGNGREFPQRTLPGVLPGQNGDDQ
jgi:hypothetical protein